MAARDRIKKPRKNRGARISAEDIPNYDNNPPVFSLERLQAGNYCLSNLNQEEKANFAEAIFRRRSLPWREIKKQDRHGLGFEKIDKDSIKAESPAFITEDKHTLLAFRFCGMKPMVDYRVRDIFFVLWFDRSFTLYDH